MVRISDNGPAGNKAKRLSSVNHATKTVHRHHHHAKYERLMTMRVRWLFHNVEPNLTQIIPITSHPLWSFSLISDEKCQVIQLTSVSCYN